MRDGTGRARGAKGEKRDGEMIGATAVAVYGMADGPR